MTHEPAGPDFVEIRLPMDASLLPVLRTAGTALAARLHFTLDEIEDLSIAVYEACALLLADGIDEGNLDCRFDVEPDAITVAVGAPTVSGRRPDPDTFAWSVLAALTGSVTANVSAENHVTIRMRKVRGGSSS